MWVIKSRGLVATLLVMLLWGLLFPLVKLGYKVFGILEVGDILTFAGVRFFICGLLICIFCVVKDPKTFIAAKGKLFAVLMSGVFAIILHYGFTYIGLSLTDGSKTAILKQLGAVFYICFAGLFFKDDKLNARKLKALLLGIAGILVINMDIAGIHFHIGDLFVILASFCTVFSNVISKNVFEEVEPIVATGISQLFGGVILLVVGLCSGGQIDKMMPTDAEQWFILSTIVLASIISYCVWFMIVQRENLSKLFIIKFSEPLFAALFSAIILREDIFNIQYLLAFMLISAGIVLANKKVHREEA